MISKHSTLLESYTRNLPVIGWWFLHVESKRQLEIARDDDAAFLSAMRDLGKEPEERLLNQNETLEKRLIFASFLSTTVGWVVSYFLLNHLNFIYIYILAACNAYCLEWVVIEIISRVSFRA